MRSISFAAVLLCGLLVAAEDAPHSPAVRSAMAKRDAAVGKAKRAYDTAVADADAQLVRDASAAQKAAMRAGDLVAANDAAAVSREAGGSGRAAGPAMSGVGGGKPAADSPVTGRWQMRYVGGETVWTVTPTSVTHSGIAPANQLQADGGGVVVRWSNGYVDRLTAMADGRLAIESWEPKVAEQFRSAAPTGYAIGVRVK